MDEKPLWFETYIPFGFVADNVLFMIKSTGAYFIGYTLSAMVANLIYALFLCGRELKLWRVIVARLLVILVVTFGLNGIWTLMFFGGFAGAFYSLARVIKNLAQLPLDEFLLYVLAQLPLRIQRRRG